MEYDHINKYLLIHNGTQEHIAYVHLFWGQIQDTIASKLNYYSVVFKVCFNNVITIELPPVPP